MPSSRLSRPVARFAVAAGVLAGCVGSAPEPAPSPTAPDPAEALGVLNDAIAGIAEEQAALAPPTADVLSSLRAVDEAVEAMRDPERIDAAVDAWPPVAGGIDAAPLEAVRQAARELAADLDQTRAELARTRSSLDDEWEGSYLDAQDLVLQEVRAYARASDELAQVLALHVPTYRQVIEETGAFADRRGFYRSAEEASDAYEVELRPLLEDLSVARQEVASYVVRRDDAAAELNAATAAAADVWAARPDRAPAPTVTSP